MRRRSRRQSIEIRTWQWWSCDEMDYVVNFHAVFLLWEKGQIVAIDALEKVQTVS